VRLLPSITSKEKEQQAHQKLARSRHRSVTMLKFLLSFLCLGAVAHAGISVDLDRGLQSGDCNGTPLWTTSQVRSYPVSSRCLIILYGTVYDLKGFADIHRGGSFAITRNCGRDATAGFERLQCIAGVPDHNRGLLNLVSTYVVGVIQGGEADLCANPNPKPAPTPNFDACLVYDTLKCSQLNAMPKGKWTMDEVAASTTGCIVVLYNYVYDLDSPPQMNPTTPPGSGNRTFAAKHVGGRPAILNRCRSDLTPVFENWVPRPGAPSHNKGTANAIIQYLVGVIGGSDADPCTNPPPAPTCGSHELTYYTMASVQASTTGCLAVVLGKVYNLQTFSQLHYGGQDAILEHCRQDVTSDFLEKPFHKVVHLGSIKQWQVGVIEGGIADPCGSNFAIYPLSLYRTGGDETGYGPIQGTPSFRKSHAV
jgi:cytochrome b involved in lipid metabolism